MKDNDKALIAVDRLIQDPRILLYAEDICEVLGCSPQSIRDQAQRDPGKLGFQVLIWGTQLRVPRIPFLNALGVDAKFGDLNYEKG